MDNSTKRFVIESNAIEGYSGDKYLEGSKHFDQHLDAYNFLSKHDINVNTICTAHMILSNGIVEDSEWEGQLRMKQVYVGNHTPTKPEFVYVALKELCQHTPTTKGECFEWHCKFEKIHPFMDGNGRIGRCILNAQMAKINEPVWIINAEDKYEYFVRLREA